jgi:hypothetical protein
MLKENLLDISRRFFVVEGYKLTTENETKNPRKDKSVKIEHYQKAKPAGYKSPKFIFFIATNSTS